MLELGWITSMNWDYTAVDVEFADHWAASDQLRSERIFGEFPKPQQTNENILRWIFVGQESLPSVVTDIVATNEFNLHSQQKPAIWYVGHKSRGTNSSWPNRQVDQHKIALEEQMTLILLNLLSMS